MADGEVMTGSSMPAYQGLPMARAMLGELFCAQVSRRPDAVDLVCRDLRLTYGGLYAEASRVAGQLRALGACSATRLAWWSPTLPATTST